MLSTYSSRMDVSVGAPALARAAAVGGFACAVLAGDGFDVVLGGRFDIAVGIDFIFGTTQSTSDRRTETPIDPGSATSTRTGSGSGPVAVAVAVAVAV
jgi:hypothetical protein